MNDHPQSYEDFQNSIFEQVHRLRSKAVAKELIQFAYRAGISQDELIRIVISSKDKDGEDILNTLHARLDARNK